MKLYNFRATCNGPGWSCPLDSVCSLYAVEIQLNMNFYCLYSSTISKNNWLNMNRVEPIVEVRYICVSINISHDQSK